MTPQEIDDLLYCESCARGLQPTRITPVGRGGSGGSYYHLINGALMPCRRNLAADQIVDLIKLIESRALAQNEKTA